MSQLCLQIYQLYFAVNMAAIHTETRYLSKQGRQAGRIFLFERVKILYRTVPVLGVFKRLN